MMKKLIILAGLLVSLQANAQNYAKQWCADNGDGTYTNPIINSDFPDPPYRIQTCVGSRYCAPVRIR
jgi:hypothetical protein